VATIHSLNQSITQMTNDQAILIIQKIRIDRFVIPERRVAIVKAKGIASVAKEKRIVNVLQAMSPEQRADLIKMLEEQE
jgi:hypothetical protein